MPVMTNKVRIVDIARALSVSPATVSLAIHNKPGVSERVRADVLKACKELGYATESKSQAAAGPRLLRLCIYKKHGQVVCDTQFFSELIEGIEYETKQSNYELLISYYNEKTDSAELLQRFLSGGEVAGCILLATEMFEEDLQAFQDLKCPLVVLDNVFKKARVAVDYVLIDNVNGIYDITEYLISCGHTRIGYVKSRYVINNFKERKKGYCLALQDHHLEFDPKYEYEVGAAPETAYRDMLGILDEGAKLPSALVVENDLIAFGVMKALMERGIRIPEDISIVGFDDVVNIALVDPALTTVHVHKGAMGRAAVRQLVRSIEDKRSGLEEYSAVMRMKTELVIKDSVKCLQ